MDDVNEYEVGYRFEVEGTTAGFDFIYPRTGERVQRLTVGLEDVRAANEIEIRYDFERDGWVIESPTIFAWDLGGPYDPGMEEVAFIPSYSPKARVELARVND